MKKYELPDTVVDWFLVCLIMAVIALAAVGVYGTLSESTIEHKAKYEWPAQCGEYGRKYNVWTRWDAEAVECLYDTSRTWKGESIRVAK